MLNSKFMDCIRLQVWKPEGLKLLILKFDENNWS